MTIRCHICGFFLFPSVVGVFLLLLKSDQLSLELAYCDEGAAYVGDGTSLGVAKRVGDLIDLRVNGGDYFWRRAENGGCDGD